LSADPQTSVDFCTEGVGEVARGGEGRPVSCVRGVGAVRSGTVFTLDGGLL